LIVVGTNVVAYLLLPGPKTELFQRLPVAGLLQLPPALALLQQAVESLAIHDLFVSSEAVL
jgi:hypothetical protein